MSTVRYGPISNQQRDWKGVGEWLTSQRNHLINSAQVQNSPSDKVLIILGDSDPVISCAELQEDAIEVLGIENVKFWILDAGHELPITKSEEIVRMMLDSWKVK